MTTRDIYITKMKLQLDELNLQMGKLEARAQEAREDVRDKYQAEMSKLHAQSELAKAKLADMQASSESAWDKMVAEMDKVRDAFVHSFSYFKSQV
jgi:predicted  nucleic acid-binding Zn-ribbon protein